MNVCVCAKHAALDSQLHWGKYGIEEVSRQQCRHVWVSRRSTKKQRFCAKTWSCIEKLDDEWLEHVQTHAYNVRSVVVQYVYVCMTVCGSRIFLLVASLTLL